MSRTWLNGISDGAVICCVEPYSRTLCQVHGPSIATISKTVVSPTGRRITQPVGGYLDRVLKAYDAIYSGSRRCTKEPKTRRDKGVRRDLHALEQRRESTGAAEPEAVFLRKRKAAIDDVVEATAAAKASKMRTASIGVAVCADSESMLGGGVEAVRARAAERGRRKDVASGKADAARLALARGQARGPDNGVPEASGSGSAASSKRAAQRWSKPAPTVPRSDAGGRVVSFSVLSERGVSLPGILERRGWRAVVNIGSWLKIAFADAGEAKRPKYSERVVVLKTLSANTLMTNQTALVCRLVGAFLTTIGEATKSCDSRHVPAQGVFYRGCQGKNVRACLSPAFRAKAELSMLADCIQAMMAHPRCEALRDGESLDALVNRYSKYVEDRGQLSKPWLSMAFVCVDAADVSKYSDQCKSCPRLVCTLETFLADRCPVDATTQPLVFW
jgi:hypothetical protein